MLRGIYILSVYVLVSPLLTGIEPRALSMMVRCSPTDLYPSVVVPLCRGMHNNIIKVKMPQRDRVPSSL